MNEFLAVEIMKIIQSGESFGFFTIRTDIMKMESFFELTEQEYKETMTALEVNKCLLRGLERDTFILNPDKDCIQFYGKKSTAAQDIQAQESQIKTLTRDNLIANNALIKLQTKEAKNKIKFALLGSIGGIILERGISWIIEHL